LSRSPGNELFLLGDSATGAGLVIRERQDVGSWTTVATLALESGDQISDFAASETEFYLVGSDYPGGDGLFVRVSAEGQLLSRATRGGAGDEWVRRVVIGADGQVFAAGYHGPSYVESDWLFVTPWPD
jgi:hypothetical protein